MPAEETVEETAQETVEEIAPPPAPVEPAKKKRRWFGLKTLLLLMIVAMGATAAGTWYLLPSHVQVTGQLRFENFKRLTELERHNLDKAQQTLLSSPEVRKAARANLMAMGHSVSPGFLDSPSEYGQAIAGAKLDLGSGVLVVHYVGTDARSERPRMLALLTALYNGNRGLKDRAVALEDEVARLTKDQQEKQKELDTIRAQLDQYKRAALGGPDPGEMTRLQSDATRLEGECNDALAATTKVRDEVNKIKQAVAAQASALATTAPVVDTQLAQYQHEHQQLNQRIAMVKGRRMKKAAEARASLDAATAAFEKQIKSAQDAVKSDPRAGQVLCRRPGAAGFLEGSDRSVSPPPAGAGTARLGELKSRLGEKMEAAKGDAMKSDPKLKQYYEQQELKTRQYNAALGAGLTKEASELKADLSLLGEMIKARQTQLGDNQLYADAISQLQKIIDDTKKGIEDDRKESANMLEQLRVAFANNQPTTQKLPVDQKVLAQELQTRLSAVEEARKQYTDAAELANAQADDDIRLMEQNADSLAAKIAARQRELAAERDKNYGLLTPDQQQALLAKKQQELSQAQTAQASARAAYDAAKQKLADANARLQAAQDAGEKRNALMQIYDERGKELAQVSSQLEMKQQLANARAIPVAPTDADVTIVTQTSPRHRLQYMLASTGAMTAIFVVLMVLNAAGGRRGTPRPPFAHAVTQPTAIAQRRAR